MTYSCFDNQGIAGTGNLLNTDPQLVRPFYKLAPTSPCIDRGNVASPLPVTDYEGDPRSSISRPNGQAHPDIGADEYIQDGSARNYGLRDYGFLEFSPSISSPNRRIVINQPLTIDLTDAIMPYPRLPATSAFLVMGLRDGSGDLPFDLAPLGAPGSWMWTDMAAVLGMVPVTPMGTASVTLPLPNEPLLVGKTVTFQWFAALPQGNVAGIVTSNGLRVTIGQ